MVKGPRLGLHLNLKKCQVYWPSGDQLFLELPSDVHRVREALDGVDLLGTPVWGTAGFFDSFVATQVNKMLELQSYLGDLEDPQVDLHLLRSCLSTCKIGHLLRTIPLAVADEQLQCFDVGLRSILSQILRCSISDKSWLQATLPLRLGGLCLRESQCVSPVAFFASCCNSHTLVAQLLHCDTDIIFHLPDKSDTSERLKQLLPNWVPLVDNITQRSIQDLLDKVQSSKLLANCNLRDMARLNKQSKGLHTQAWLQAVLNPNLGLALTSSEFSVALCYWL